MEDNRQRFEWDTANIGHLARHGISPLEAEEVILDPDVIIMEFENEREDRFKGVGATRIGRILVAVFTLRGESIRPITAYPAPKQMERLYLEERAK